MANRVHNTSSYKLNTRELTLSKFEPKMSVTALLRTHLHCCVVSGLDNFVIYLSSVFPTEGLAVDTMDTSYKRCGSYSSSVSASEEIAVRCAATSEKFRYVIIQSADITPENLCIAEVAVYIGGLYLTMFLFVQQSCCI